MLTIFKLGIIIGILESHIFGQMIKWELYPRKRKKIFMSKNIRTRFLNNNLLSNGCYNKIK